MLTTGTCLRVPLSTHHQVVVNESKAFLTPDPTFVLAQEVNAFL